MKTLRRYFCLISCPFLIVLFLLLLFFIFFLCLYLSPFPSHPHSSPPFHFFLLFLTFYFDFTFFHHCFFLSFSSSSFCLSSSSLHSSKFPSFSPFLLLLPLDPTSTPRPPPLPLIFLVLWVIRRNSPPCLLQIFVKSLEVPTATFLRESVLGTTHLPLSPSLPPPQCLIALTTQLPRPSVLIHSQQADRQANKTIPSRKYIRSLMHSRRRNARTHT